MNITHDDLQDAQRWAAQAAADEEAALAYQRMLEDEAYRAQRAAEDADAEAGAVRPSTGRACACCGRPSLQADAPLCLACTLLDEEETDDSERWNYPEQHHDHE